MLLGALQHTQPLDIRLQCNLMNTLLQIMRKPATSALKVKLLNLQYDVHFISANVRSPVGHFARATSSLADFIPEPFVFETMEDILSPPINAVITKEKIGSSGNRTEEQMKRAQEKANEYLAQTANDIVVFTDGSALPNPGPCGAGVCIFWAGLSAKSSEHALPVSSYSTSYHDELKA